MHPTAAAIETIRPGDLPAPPEHALRVVQACSKPETTNNQIAEIISRDPVLSAEILRIANSAFFGLRNEVRSAAHAVIVLGHRALRNIVLCTAMRDALRPEQIPGLDLNRYWEDALRRAVSAQMLATFAHIDPDECFTAGLLQDFGLLIMIYLMQDYINEWETLSAANPDERYAMEQDLFGITHDCAGESLAASWGLPQDLSHAMAWHHRPPPESAAESDQTLCTVAMCADWMSAVYTCTDGPAALEKTRQLLQQHFNIGAQQHESIMSNLPDELRDTASTLGFRIGNQPPLEEVIRDANLRLAEENVSYQELTWKLQQALTERDRYAAELRGELELAREVQRSLLVHENHQVPGTTGINVPAKEVSGDFFDYYRLKDGRIYFCMADVSGKGMNAALLMAKTSSLFHCLGKAVHHPGQLLSMINQEIAETSIRGMFVTMIAGIYQPDTGLVRISNAGHLPAVHISTQGQVVEYEALAQPLGILPRCRFPLAEFTLDDGALYLFTDGLIEARTEGDNRLEMEGLEKLIMQHKQLPPQKRIQAIIDQVIGPGGVGEDDLTMLVIEARTSAPPVATG